MYLYLYDWFNLFNSNLINYIENKKKNKMRRITVDYYIQNKNEIAR